MPVVKGRSCFAKGKRQEDTDKRAVEKKVGQFEARTRKKASANAEKP